MTRILARLALRILAFGGLLMTTVASQPAHAGWRVTILHPAGTGSSLANGGYSTQQVGEAAIGSKDHASLWSGSAASWTDLQPAGYQWSWANATSGAQQCSSALDSAGVGRLGTARLDVYAHSQPARASGPLVSHRGQEQSKR